jgi:hypothetical protein
MTRDWRLSLDELAKRGRARVYPLLVFEVHAPSGLTWPTELPAHLPLEEFYRLCDGGYIAHINFARMADIIRLTQRWVATLRAWDNRGDVLDPRRHVVWAEDAGGCPLIVNASDGVVRTFQPDGGNWERGHVGVDAFLMWLFNESGPDDWRQALATLEHPGAS